MTVLDEHVMQPWKPGGPMSTNGRRAYRRSRGAPTWRIVRYADYFAILVHGTREDTEALREDVAAVLAPLGLRLSPRSEEHTSELQSPCNLVCRLLLEKKKKKIICSFHDKKKNNKNTKK